MIGQSPTSPWRCREIAREHLSAVPVKLASQASDGEVASRTLESTWGQNVWDLGLGSQIQQSSKHRDAYPPYEFDGPSRAGRCRLFPI